MKAAVLGANGIVGRFFSRLFASQGDLVARVDVNQRPVEELPGAYVSADVTIPSEALTAALTFADCTLVCLPERVAMAAVPTIFEAGRRGMLWVDTLSVKAEVCMALEAYAERNEILSINPMFKPENDLTAKNVGVVPIRKGLLAEEFLALLNSKGAILTELTTEEHDRLTATVQVATHAAALVFGMTLLRHGYDCRIAARLSTPPHRLLLALVARMTS